MTTEEQAFAALGLAWGVLQFMLERRYRAQRDTVTALADAHQARLEERAEEERQKDRVHAELTRLVDAALARGDENRKALEALRLLLAEDYIRRRDWEAFDTRYTSRLDAIAVQIAQLGEGLAEQRGRAGGNANVPRR